MYLINEPGFTVYTFFLQIILLYQMFFFCILNRFL